MNSGLPTFSLTVDDLSATRGGVEVASGVAFTLRPGAALTLRGPNGSGKTSILRAIAGFSPLASGEVTFFEDDAELDAAEARATALHWLGGEDGLAARMSVEEHLAFWQQLLAARAAEALPPIADVLARIGLTAKASAAAGALSTGQRRRLGMGRLLVAPRPLWLLDEPVSGLDVAGRETLFELIAAHRAAGGLVLMASHDEGLPEAPVLRLAVAEDA